MRSTVMRYTNSQNLFFFLFLDLCHTHLNHLTLSIQVLLFPGSSLLSFTSDAWLFSLCDGEVAQKCKIQESSQLSRF